MQKFLDPFLVQLVRSGGEHTHIDQVEVKHFFDITKPPLVSTFSVSQFISHLGNLKLESPVMGEINFIRSAILLEAQAWVREHTESPQQVKQAMSYLNLTCDKRAWLGLNETCDQFGLYTMNVKSEYQMVLVMNEIKTQDAEEYALFKSVVARIEGNPLEAVMSHDIVFVTLKE